MATNNEVTIEILAEFKNAVKGMEAFQKESIAALKQIATENKKALDKQQKDTNTALKKMGDGYNALKNVAIAAVGFIASKAILNAFANTIKAASAEEDAINELNTALQLTGIYSANSSRDMVKFADSIEKTTKFSGEQVLQSAALIQNLGRLSEEGLKEATKAATNLAAALNIDLNTAANLVGKAAEGNVGVFKRYGITIQEGNSKAEAFANTLEVLNSRFGGAAAAQVNTFSGAYAQLENSIGDLAKSFGRLVVQNPSVIAGFNILSKFVGILTDSFEKNTGPMKDFITEMTKLAIEVIPNMVSPAQFLTVFFSEIVKLIIRIAEGLSLISGLIISVFDKELGGSITNISKGLTKSRENMDNFAEGVVTGLETARKPLEKAAKDFNKIKKSVENTKPAIKGFNKTIEELDPRLIETVRGSFDKLRDSVKTLDQENAKLTRSRLDQINQEYQANIELAAQSLRELGLQGKLTEEAQEQIKKFLELARLKKELAEGQLSIFDLNVSELGTRLREAFNSVKDLFSGEGILRALTAGGDALTKALNNITVGDIATSLTGAFTSGAEIFKNTLNGEYLNSLSSFVDDFGNLPKKFVDIANSFNEVVDKLFESLPKVFESINRALPALLDRLISALPQLAEMLIPLFQNLAQVIADKAPAFASAILSAITKLVDAIPGIVDTLLKALPKVFRAILQALPKLITAILNAIPQIVRSIAQIIPELVAELAANIGPIIIALVQGILEAIPTIILVLIDEFIVKGGIFKIVGAIIAAMPDIAIALVQGVVRAAFNSTKELTSFLGKGIGDSFTSAIKVPKIDFDIGAAKDALTGKLFVNKFKENAEGIRNFLSGKTFTDKLKEKFDEILAKLKNILSAGIKVGGSGSSGKGPVTGIKGSPFAEGGQGFLRVPGGFPNDSFPATLTSGELVIDRSTAFKLKEFLDGDTRSGFDMSALAEIIMSRPAIINVTLNEETLATAVFNARRRGFRI